MKITEVGKYRVEQMIGSGSYGKVYRGRDKLTGEIVALKVIQRRGKNKKEFQSLRQQIEILKRLNHPNIVLLKDHVEAEQFMILIMEYAPKDLAGILKQAVKMKEEDVRRFAKEILSALRYLSDNRIVHRDLKPQNILLNEANVIKICDFGFARKMSAATVCLHSMKGTPLYIAPEIIEMKPYGYKIDIWSLGIIMYELFAGVPPFIADSLQRLAPKIIHDKVVYPNNMAVELRELIQGMLQKNPTNRYDWIDLEKHPFFNPPPPPPPKAVEPVIKVLEPQEPAIPQAKKNFDSFVMMFSVMIDSEKVSKSIRVNDQLTLQQLKQHQKGLKTGSNKQLKTDMMFYHQLMLLLNKYLNEQGSVQNELLIIACRVVILLISKVKLQQDLTDKDITQQNDLFVSIAKIIGVCNDQDCLQQLYTLCLYLLKITFNSKTQQIQSDIALDIIQSTCKVLQKQNISLQIQNLIYKTIGTLAVQIAITVRNSSELLKLAKESKLLTFIAARYRPDKESSTVFECIQKFVYPAKYKHYDNQLSQLIASLSVDVAVGLLPRVQQLNAVTKIYSKSEQQYFLRVIYACIKASPEFTREIFTTGVFSSIQQINKTYALAIVECAMKREKVQLSNIENLCEQSNPETTQIQQLYQCSLTYLATKHDAIRPSRTRLSATIKKLGQLLKVDENKFEEGIKQLEGWPSEYYDYTFSDIVIETVIGMLRLQGELLVTIRDCEIIFNLNIVKNDQINLSSKSILSFLIVVQRIIETFEIDVKSFKMLQTMLPFVLSEESIGLIRSSPEIESTQLLNIAFDLICRLIIKDENALGDLFIKLQAENIHRIIFMDSLLNEQTLLLTLKVIMRILKKCDTNVLDYLALQGLPKLMPYLQNRNTQLLSRILHVISTIARAKVEFYPLLKSLDFVDKLPIFLSDTDLRIRIKALNLIGNMAKYSNFFIDSFKEHKIPTAIIGTLSSAGGNHENLVYQAIFALGNICFFGQQPTEVIAPLIPYLYEALFITAQAFLCNTLGTLTHLVRHGRNHIKSLLEYKLLPKITQTVQQTTFVSVQIRGLSFIEKITDHSQVFAVYSAPQIKASLSKIKPLHAEVKERIDRIIAKLK